MKNEKAIKLNVLVHGVTFNEETLRQFEQEPTKFGHGLFNYAGTHAPTSVPQEFWLSENTGIRIHYKHESPYSLQYDQNGILYLAFQGERLQDVRLGERPSYYDVPLQDGTLANKIVQINGKDRLNVYVYNYCTYTNHKVACRFCNVSASGPNLEVQIRKEHELIAEAVEIAHQHGAFSHLCFSGGVTPTPDGGAENFIRIAETIRARMGWDKIDGDISMVPPGDLSYIDRLYDTGIDTLSMNLEVCDPQLFEIICPGKHQTGMQEYLHTFQHIVKRFGRGKGRSNLVLGLESIRSFKEGTERLADLGIVPTTNVYWQSNGEYLRHREAETIEYYLEAYQWLADLYRQYELNPIWCHRCTIASLDNESHLLSV